MPQPPFSPFDRHVDKPRPGFIDLGDGAVGLFATEDDLREHVESKIRHKLTNADWPVVRWNLMGWGAIRAAHKGPVQGYTILKRYGPGDSPSEELEQRAPEIVDNATAKAKEAEFAHLNRYIDARVAERFIALERRISELEAHR